MDQGRQAGGEDDAVELPSLPLQRGAAVAEPNRLQPRQPVAAAGAAEGHRQLVANQLAAAAGENRRAVDKTRPLLLAPAGGEPPHTAAVRRPTAEDHGLAGAGGIADCWVVEKMPEEATSEGPVLEKSVSKRTDVGPRGCPGARPRLTCGGRSRS